MKTCPFPTGPILAIGPLGYRPDLDMDSKTNQIFNPIDREKP